MMTARSSTSSTPRVRPPAVVLESTRLTRFRSFAFSLIVQASLTSHVFAISGSNELKEFSELLPGIISQMGSESLSTLRKLAEKFKSAEGANDEGIPDLVDGTFEEVADKKDGEIDE